MRIILTFLSVLTSFWLLFFLTTNNIYAQCGGCEVSGICYPNDETPDPNDCDFVDGCSCTLTNCPSGTYTAPDGSCHAVGSNLQCGDWYDCPTPNNPAKMCKVDCGGGGGAEACFPATVNCPAGTVKSSTVVDTFCPNQVIPGDNNRWSMCGGIGSAQQTTSTCCFEQTFKTDDCWITPSGVERCESETVCMAYNVNTYSCVSTCNTTAPSGVSVVQGSSASVANLKIVVVQVVLWANCSDFA